MLQLGVLIVVMTQQRGTLTVQPPKSKAARGAVVSSREIPTVNHLSCFHQAFVPKEKHKPKAPTKKQSSARALHPRGRCEKEIRLPLNFLLQRDDSFRNLHLQKKPDYGSFCKRGGQVVVLIFLAKFPALCFGNRSPALSQGGE